MGVIKKLVPNVEIACFESMFAITVVVNVLGYGY